MPVPANVTERRYHSVQAAVAIDVDIQTHSLNYISVEYGDDRLPADEGSDYLIYGLDADTGFFKVRPMQPLIDKMAANVQSNNIFVFRLTPETSDFVEGDTPVRRKVNNEFEEHMMIMQELAHYLENVTWRGGPYLRPKTNPSVLTMPVPNAGSFIRWAGDNEHLENADVSPVGSATLDVDTAFSMAEMRAKVSNPRIIILRSYYSDNVRGGSLFYLDASDLATLDDGFNTVLLSGGRRFKRLIAPQRTDLFMLGALGNRGRNDTQELQAAIDWSQQTGQKVIIPSQYNFAVGTPGSNNIPLKIGNGQGPILHGDGKFSKIERIAGYGNPGGGGTEGGGSGGGSSFRLLTMKNDGDVADHMELKDFAIGNNDPLGTALYQGGHMILLRCTNSLIENIWGIDSKGILMNIFAVDTVIRGIRSEHAHILGGASMRFGMSKRIVVEDCVTESADDDMFVTIKHGDRVIGDPTDNMAGDIHFRNNISKAKQGAAYGILAGGKKSNLRTPRTTTCKTRIDTNTIRVKAPNTFPQVGDTVMVYDSVGGGGLGAGQVNGVRTINDIDTNAEKNTFFITVGGTVTVDNQNVGDDTRVQGIRIGTTNGSNIVRFYIASHEVPLGQTIIIRIANWTTVANITANDVRGNRVATYVTPNILSIVADVNANADTDINTVFANKDMGVGFLMDAGITNVTFDRITGYSGDSAATEHGGIGRKFFLSESPYDCAIKADNCDLVHHDTVDRPFTKALAYFASLELTLRNDTVRTPRACAFLMQGDPGCFGVFKDCQLTLDKPMWFGTTIPQNPLLIMDGGRLTVIGGELRGNGTADTVLCAESYNLNQMDDGQRIMNADRDGADNSYMFCEEVNFIGTRFSNIGDGCFGVRLGNVKRGSAIACIFRGAFGATTWGCFKMRTGTTDPGTTNFIIRDCDYGDCLAANRVVNFQSGKGNVWYDVPAYPRVIAAKYIPTFAGATADNNALGAGVDTFVAMPYMVDRYADMGLTGIAIWVTLQGTTSAFKCAVYASDVLTGKPTGAPLAKDETGTATVTANAAAANTDAMIATLKKGTLVWVITKHTGAVLPQCTSPIRGTTWLTAMIGRDAMGASGLTCIKRNTGAAYATAWPTLNGGETWNDSTDNGSPIVFLKT
jgi:hypothetical protein